jgi:hypothetical protein
MVPLRPSEARHHLADGSHRGRIIVNSTSRAGFTLGPIDQLGRSALFAMTFAYYDKLSARDTPTA